MPTALPAAPPTPTPTPVTGTCQSQDEAVQLPEPQLSQTGELTQHVCQQPHAETASWRLVINVMWLAQRQLQVHKSQAGSRQGDQG